GGGLGWTRDEESRLRQQYVEMLYAEGRYSEEADYLAKWLQLNPETSYPYLRYLSALVRTNQLEKVNDLIAQWLRPGQKPGELPAADFARLSAAVSLARGWGEELRNDRIEERWLEPLAKVVLAHARVDKQASLADEIMSHSQFHDSDQCRRVRTEALRILIAQADTLG